MTKLKTPSNFFPYKTQILFFALLIVEISHWLFLVLTHRLPIGHDGFQYFCIQYFFLNDGAINGEVPLWIPFMSHGMPATWFYTIQGSINILSNALLLVGHSLASINALTIFQSGIFVDRLLLLCGAWLLSTRYFNNVWTTFFVTSVAMASSISMTQFNFTLHLYYAIPLLFYFGHAFLDTGRWRYFFLACNLFMIQCFGKNADTETIVTLTVFLYFLFYTLDQPSYVGNQIRKLPLGSSCAWAIAGSLISLGILAATFLAAKDPSMVNLNGGRNGDSSVPLDIFLTYAGNMNFNKWQEMLLRLSPSLDFTIYIGFLALPLIFFGLLFNRNRCRFPLLLVSLILLFFSMGTWVSMFFYYAWPMMKFYRHLALIVPMIKLLLIFLAGFGFESLFVDRIDWQGKRGISYACLLSAGLLLTVSMILFKMSTHGLASSHYIISHLTVQTSQTPAMFDALTVSHRLRLAAIYALLTALLLLLLPFKIFKQYPAVILLLALLINAADIYGYYCTETNERTFALNQDQYHITAFSPMPYASRRLVAQPNARANILLSPIGHMTVYATINAFLFQDALATPYRTIERQKPLDDLVNAFGPKVLNNPTFLKIAGSTEDKIQFFNDACASPDQATALLLSNPLSLGDSLLISAQASPMLPECSNQHILNSRNRLNIPYKIEKFTPNTLELSTYISSKRLVWMMYADVWHKNWQVMINDKPSILYKSDLAYKAILLSPGINRIKFIYNDEKIAILEKIISFNALAWMLLILYLILENLTLIPQVFTIKPVK